MTLQPEYTTEFVMHVSMFVGTFFNTSVSLGKRRLLLPAYSRTWNPALSDTLQLKKQNYKYEQQRKQRQCGCFVGGQISQGLSSVDISHQVKTSSQLASTTWWFLLTGYGPPLQAQVLLTWQNKCLSFCAERCVLINFRHKYECVLKSQTPEKPKPSGVKEGREINQHTLMDI